MITHTIDSSVMRRRLATMEGNRARARDAAATTLGASILRSVVTRAVGAGGRNTGGVAYDTGRYARAYAMGHNMLVGVGDAGVLPMPLPALRPSDYLGLIRRRTELQLKRLEKAHVRWTGLKERDERKPNHRRWKSYRQKLKILDRIERSMELAIEHYKTAIRADRAGLAGDAEGAAAIFIGGRATKTQFRVSNLGRVDVKIHGGSASLHRVGGQSLVEMRNAEPHARIVERRTRLMARAIAGARRDAPGLRRIGAKHLALLTVNAQGQLRRAA